VVVAILAKDKAMYLPLFLKCLESQTWPKQRTHLYVRSNDNRDETIPILERWLSRVRGEYASVHEDYSSVDSGLTKYGEHEWNPHRFRVLSKIREDSVAYAQKLGCHYLVVDCDNFIQPNVIETLVELVGAGFQVAGPLLPTEGTRSANFFLEADADGYYKEVPYYDSVQRREVRGVLRVDVIHCTYIIEWEVQDWIRYDDDSRRYEFLVFSDLLRKAGIPQFVDNRRDYGRLVQCASEQDFIRELRVLKSQFECWNDPETLSHIQSLLDKDDRGRTVTHTTPLGTFTLLRDEEFIMEPLLAGRAWDERLLGSILPTLSRDEDVVDVGAHVGTHAVPYARHSRHVHAFEPQEPMHALLLQNLRANGCDNVTTHRCALGHESGTVYLSRRFSDGRSAGRMVDYDDGAMPANYGGIQIDAEGAPAEIRTLDALDTDAVRLLKVDVEGAEPLVFFGAQATIRRHRPLILFEQNYKRLEAEVLERLGVPSEVREFRVADYCRSLGYHLPVELVRENFLLLPMRSEKLARRLPLSFTQGSFRLDPEGRAWCSMPGRGEFPTGILDDETIAVWFGDYGELIVGKVRSPIIDWQNGTRWQTTATPAMAFGS
jgi:FkbM family methyltransferase